MNVDKTQAIPVGIGAAAGLGIGAGAGVMVANKRPAANDYKDAVTKFADARDSFIGRSKHYAKGLNDAKAFIEEQDIVKTAQEKVADATKAKKELASDATDKAKEAAQKAIDIAKEKVKDAQRKAAVDFLNKEENKSLKAGVEKMVKEFKEGKGKDLADKVDSAAKTLKNTRIKWAAGLAAVGIAIGAGAGIALNKIKAGKAEKAAEEQAQ